MRFILALLLATLILTTTAVASHVFLESVRTDQAQPSGTEAVVRVEIDTQGDRNIRMRASIPELGIYRSAGPINVNLKHGRGSEVTRTIILPTEDVAPGEYWVRIYVKTDGRKIVKHRPLIIY